MTSPEQVMNLLALLLRRNQTTYEEVTESRKLNGQYLHRLKEDRTIIKDLRDIVAKEFNLPVGKWLTDAPDEIAF